MTECVCVCVRVFGSSPRDRTVSLVKRIAALPSTGFESGSLFDLLLRPRVPEGHAWILGDNPAVSYDSRSYGPVTGIARCAFNFRFIVCVCVCVLDANGID